MLRRRGKADITTPPKDENSKEVAKCKETKITVNKDAGPTLHEAIKPIIFMSLMVGYTPKRFRVLGIIGGLLWLTSLLVHTAFDFMSARKTYGYAWASIQILLFINLVMCTYSIRGKVVPWLEKSVGELDNERKYFKTFARIRKLFRVIPCFVILFSVLGTGLQFFCFYYDKAFSVTFEQSVSKGWEIGLLSVWFITNVHLLFAFSFFWCATVCNMYTTGYSMTEYHDMMTTHLKNKETPVTFRQAVHSFAARGKFLKKSASSCRIALSFLLIYSVASLGVNAFYYLYKTRRASYIFFALMPPICSVYPLCLAAWVTKTYKWYLAVVVKAWAERPESSDEDESGSDRPRHGKNKNKSFARRFTKRVKNATSRDEVGEDEKPRRRSIFTRAMPFISGSLTDLDNSDGKKDEKPRRRSLFVSAMKPLDGGAFSDTEGYAKNKKTRRRSLFERAKPPVSGVLSDTEAYSTKLKKKEKEKSNKPRRQSLFARAKTSSNGSYSDTEGYPEKKTGDELKPRRRSLFARPKSASSVPFFENQGFSPDKVPAESPKIKKKFASMTQITNFSPLSETEGESEEQQQSSSELKKSTDRFDLPKATANRLDSDSSGTRQTNEDTPSARRVDSDGKWDQLTALKPRNRLEPLNATSTIKEHEILGVNEKDNFLKSSQDIMKTQHSLKPLNIERPVSEDDATDDENRRKESDSSPSIKQQARLVVTQPTSEDESTDGENKTEVTDVIPRASRQDMIKYNLALDMSRTASEDEGTDDENRPSENYKDMKEVVDQNRLKPTDIPRQLTDDEATDDESNPKKTDGKSKVNRQRVMELILRGTARAVGRLQHRAKMPKFNFEKYISYLQNVLPTIGFKIMGITVTWEMVSTLLFLEVSLLALFMQESIFGNQQANVAL